MSIGMLLISVELLPDALHPALHPGRLRRTLASSASPSVSRSRVALRVAGGIFTKIADIGADLMKIAFKVKEDDPRDGRHRRLHRRQRGRLGRPRGHGFETMGSPASPSSRSSCWR